MVHHHRQSQQQRKGDEEQQLLPALPPMSLQHQHQAEEAMESGRGHRRLFQDYCAGRKARPRLYCLAFLFCFVSLTLLAAPRLLFGSSYSSLPFYFFGAEEDAAAMQGPEKKVVLPCSSVPDNTICCDRTTSFRTDVCVMRGDVRTRSSASEILLYNSAMKTHTRKMRKKNNNTIVETIRPYTRKWESSIMQTIDNLSLVATPTGADDSTHRCDVVHDVPAVFFSTGGYTGNVYHEFNDGILPLYITSQRFGRKVVFVMLEYHEWWVTKYEDILSQLSDYPPVDFSGDRRTHCFPEAVVGLRIHDELAIDAQQMPNDKTILDFRKMLDNAYRPRIRSIEEEEAKAAAEAPSSQEGEDAQEPSVMEKPKLVIVSRNGSRGIDNEEELVRLCEEIGFSVNVLRPDRTTELAKIYRALNDSDAMIGVHGAAMTHLLFMRPGSVFIQVVPLGTDWAAETYYGSPAKRMGLKYVGYKILPRESSLYHRYAKDDPVLRDPESVTKKGWQVTKEVYLDGQSVRLDLNRFLKRLTRAYGYSVSRKNRMDEKWDWSWQLPGAPQGQARPERRR